MIYPVSALTSMVCALHVKQPYLWIARIRSKYVNLGCHFRWRRSSSPILGASKVNLFAFRKCRKTPRATAAHEVHRSSYFSQQICTYLLGKG